jgi:hypothetical protein
MPLCNAASLDKVNFQTRLDIFPPFQRQSVCRVQQTRQQRKVYFAHMPSKVPIFNHRRCRMFSEDRVRVDRSDLWDVPGRTHVILVTFQTSEWRPQRSKESSLANQ